MIPELLIGGNWLTRPEYSLRIRYFGPKLIVSLHQKCEPLIPRKCHTAKDF